MSDMQPSMVFALIGSVLITGCGPLPPDHIDDAAPAAEQGVAVFSFVPLDLESAAIASDLSGDIAQSLAKNPRIRVLADSDLPPNMQDIGNHHRWPKSEPVSFILEGSVRETEQGTTVTAQLIDAASDAHIWSDTYVSTTDDFASIVATVEDQVTQATSR